VLNYLRINIPQVGRPRLLDNCLLPLALNTREGASATLGRVE